MTRDEVYPQIQQITDLHMSFESWFTALDFGMDYSLNATELASTTNQNTNVTVSSTSTTGEVSFLEACLQWFSFYENSCYDTDVVESTSGQVVYEDDFVKTWFEIDTDFDTVITSTQFIDYFSQEGLTVADATAMFSSYFPG